MQRTFMMLKPDAFEQDKVELILQRLKQAGLVIEQAATIAVDLEVMKTLIDHYGPVLDKMDPSFNFPGKLFNSFYYGPNKRIMPLVVLYDGPEEIIEYTRHLVGATSPAKADKQSIRGALSQDSFEIAGSEHRLVNNLIHAADSLESAKRELAIWDRYLSQ